MELTNNIRKLISGLGAAKHRKATGLFKAEGTKCVLDTLPHFKPVYLVATQSWIDANRPSVERYASAVTIQAQYKDMERMTDLTTAPDVIAAFEIPRYEVDPADLDRQLVLALDTIQDPGNLGTIIRTADWFGVHTLLCSRTTADVYNPKVVQATMGAISRLRVMYCDLPSVLARLIDRGMNVYGTFLDGATIYDAQLEPSGVVVMGNEGKGISPEVAQLVNKRLFIPPFPPGAITSESLNVGIATAITLAEFRRRN